MRNWGILIIMIIIIVIITVVATSDLAESLAFINSILSITL